MNGQMHASVIRMIDLNFETTQLSPDSWKNRPQRRQEGSFREAAVALQPYVHLVFLSLFSIQQAEMCAAMDALEKCKWDFLETLFIEGLAWPKSMRGGCGQMGCEETLATFC